MPSYRTIPGTDIPSMSGKHGYQVKASGITARTRGLHDIQRQLSGKIAGGIVKVYGAKEMKANVNFALGMISVALRRGLGDAVAYIRYDMDKTPPLIPIDTGNLRSSWFTRPVDETKGGNRSVYIIAGFGDKALNKKGEPYAVYVHEMTDDAYGKKINWSRPGSGPKFLEYALKRNAKTVVKIVVAEVQAFLNSQPWL